MGDFILRAEVHHMLACEASSIVGDNGMRKPKATSKILPKQFHYLLSHDLGERHRLYPLDEVVGGYEEEPELGQSHGRGLTTSSLHCIKGEELPRL